VTVEFDAIVCGSGISGGWAAKELTERGLRVLMIERGPIIKHTEYPTEWKAPWEMPFRGSLDPKVAETTKRVQRFARMDEWTQDMYVNDDVDVYETPEESGFRWMRGYHLGGKSLMWGRQCYRLSDINLQSNAKDGHGIPWPVTYQELVPWYEHVEKFIGINGTTENLRSLPDGIFQPSMGFSKGEEVFAELIKTRYADRRVIPARSANLTQGIGDRSACQYRNQCARGCSFGAYFSTQSSTLPAAEVTGRLTILSDTIVETLDYDPATKRVTGVRIRDVNTGQRSIRTAKVVFVCTGSINSVSLLLRSVSDATPNGVGNTSGILGHYVIDQAFGATLASTMPGLDEWAHKGRKPTGVIVPRFVNLDEQTEDFARGYSYQGVAQRMGWGRSVDKPGTGAALKQGIRHPGDWAMVLEAAVEALPRFENQVSINFAKKDAFDQPLSRIDVRFTDNERKAEAHALREARAMLEPLGGQIMVLSEGNNPPGTSIHEMGGAPMGSDPTKSVTNARNQLHDALNVFVTDGAFMNSSGDRNPSLTYMAFTARAAAYAADLIKSGQL